MKQEYVQLAKDACKHVYEVCPLGSANRHNGENPTILPVVAKQALIKAKVHFDKKVEQILADPDCTEPQKNLSIIELLAEVAHEAHAGNCQEMVALAFLFLMRQGIASLELVSIPTHTFVIIGRDPDTPIENPNLWNEDVVVCDPWRRDYSTAFQSQLFHQEAMIYSSTELLIYGVDGITIGFSIYGDNAIDNQLKK